MEPKPIASGSKKKRFDSEEEPLGRPPKEEGMLEKRRQQKRQDEIDRIPIEGKFGKERELMTWLALKPKPKPLRKAGSMRCSLP